MPTFTLQFDDDGLGEGKRIEFDGDEPIAAFTILGGEMPNRRVSLFEGEKLLGVIRRTSRDGWILGNDATRSENS